MFKSFHVALHNLETSTILVDCLSMIFLDTQSVNCLDLTGVKQS